VDLATLILARSSTDDDQQVQALVCLGQAQATLGNPVDAQATVSRISDLVSSRSTVSETVALALGQAGGILQTIGQAQRAAALYQQSHDLVHDSGSPRAKAIALFNLAGLHAGAMNDPQTGDDYFRQGLEIAEEAGAATSFMFFNYGLNLGRIGRDDQAVEALTRAEELAVAEGQQGVLLRSQSARSEILFRKGLEGDAHRLLQRVVEGQRSLPDAQGEVASLRRLSVMELEAGNVQAALAAIERSMDLAASGNYPEDRIEAMKQASKVYLAAGRVSDAMRISDERHGLEIAALTSQNLQSIAGLQAQLAGQASAQDLERLQYQNQIQKLTIERSDYWRNMAIAFLALVIVVGILFAISQRRIHSRLRHLSATDPLTGLSNRRIGTARLSGLRCSPDGRNVLLLLDADNFKSVNDVHGHLVGDEVLIELANRLKALCRSDDVVARWGGEEFLIACCQPDLAHAERFAERLRRAVSEAPILIGTLSIDVSLSIGFAPMPFHPNGSADWHETLAFADQALYAAKESGRDAWAGLWGEGAAPENTASMGVVLETSSEHGCVKRVSSRAIAWDSHYDSSGEAKEATYS
jgi:diguanylate cyclase (GGDEF)-like protein